MNHVQRQAGKAQGKLIDSYVSQLVRLQERRLTVKKGQKRKIDKQAESLRTELEWLSSLTQ